MKTIVLLAAVLFFAGCATEPIVQTQTHRNEPSGGSVVAPPPSPAPAVKAAPAPAKPRATPPPAVIPTPGVHAIITMSAPPSAYKSTKKTLLVKEFLLHGKPFPQKPYNLILLSKKPSTEYEKLQYSWMCENWLATYPKTSEVSDSVSDLNIVPFYWLLSKSVSSETCDQLIQNYDYARARTIILANGLDITKIYLVCQVQNGVVTMNMSPILKEEHIAGAMNVWQTKMRVFPKSGGQIQPYTLMQSLRIVLGALGAFVAMK